MKLFKLAAEKATLPESEWLAVLKGLGIAVAGAALTAGSEYLLALDYGSYTPLVVALLSAAVNYLRKIVFRS